MTTTDLTTLSNTPCKFTFDDEKVWDGFAHGSTWNGFDNVAVTKETLDAIIAHFKAEAIKYGWGDDALDDGMAEIQPMDNGLYSLGWGYCTQIVDEVEPDGTAAVRYSDGTLEEIGRFEPFEVPVGGSVKTTDGFVVSDESEQ